MTDAQSGIKRASASVTTEFFIFAKMDIKINRDSLVIRGISELVAANARVFKERVLAVLTDSHKTIDLDLSQTSFIDSTGLGALISLDKAIRPRKGVVRLLHPTSSVLTLLELTRLHRVFEVVVRDMAMPEPETKPSSNPVRHPVSTGR